MYFGGDVSVLSIRVIAYEMRNALICLISQAQKNIMICHNIRLMSSAAAFKLWRTIMLCFM